MADVFTARQRVDPGVHLHATVNRTTDIGPRPLWTNMKPLMGRVGLEPTTGGL